MHDVRVRLAAGVGQAAEGRDDRVVVGPEVAPGQDGGPVDRHRLHDDHPGAAERSLAVVADVPLAGQAVLGHVRRVRAEVDPAAQRAMAELERLEDVREVPAGSRRSRPASAGRRHVAGRRRRDGQRAR